MKIEIKNGLIYSDDKSIADALGIVGCHWGDRIARKNGFTYVEQFVKKHAGRTFTLNEYFLIEVSCDKIRGNLADPRDHSEGFSVYIGERLLSPEASQKLRNHSPCGFSWGYGGSGPAQLSLAILLEVSGDKEFALKYYQEFKEEVVARLKPKFGMHVKCVKRWIEEKKSS